MLETNAFFANNEMITQQNCNFSFFMLVSTRFVEMKKKKIRKTCKMVDYANVIEHS